MHPRRVERPDVREQVRERGRPVDERAGEDPRVGARRELGRDGVAGGRAARARGGLVLDADGRFFSESRDERAAAVAEEVAGLGEAPAGVAVGAGGLPVLLLVLGGSGEENRGKRF